MTFSNELSDAELERLAILSEELGEAQQAIGKIIRHGFTSVNPDNPGPNNRRQLQKELGDVAYAVRMMIEACDLDAQAINVGLERKAEKIKPYLHHQSVDSQPSEVRK